MASTITTTGALFQAGGLASGLDTTSIVNSVITADSAPMLQVQKQQAAYQVQISTIASLTSKLQAFQKATDALGTSGLAPTKADSTYADFTVSGSTPNESDYSVQVETMARAAKMRSDPFSSAQDPNALGLTGNLQFSIDGVTSPSTAINMTGKSLADIADAINKQVPQVTAAIISTGTSYSLSVTRNSTGFTSTTFDQALQVIGGQGLNLQTVQDAQNATLKVDNLEIKSQSNSITGAIPGVTLTLRGQSNVATDVNFARDTSSATANIQSFITAYNDVVTLLNSQLRPDPTQAATNNPLIGTTLLGLEHSMQGLLSTKVNSSGTICTLSDLNVSMQDDGTLALDQVSYQKTFADALASDPQAANQLFTKATTGIGALVDAMVNRQLQPETVQMDDGTSLSVDGALVGETSMLKNGISSMDETVSYWQNYLDNERTRLTSTFTAMEGTIATLNMASNYLNAMFYSSSGSSVNATGYKTTSNG
jgi:flagellar hook-associated protein 2